MSRALYISSLIEDMKTKAKVVGATLASGYLAGRFAHKLGHEKGYKSGHTVGDMEGHVAGYKKGFRAGADMLDQIHTRARELQGE